MESEKDEGRRIVHSFPALHVNDEGKGGCRAARKKMAVYESYPDHMPGPSNNVAGVKRKVHSVLATMNECPHSSELYYAKCSCGMPGPSNYQNASSLSSLVMMNANSVMEQQPMCGFVSYGNCCTDENDPAVPSFLQPVNVSKQKLDACGSVSSVKLHTASSKLWMEARRGDKAMVLHGNFGEESSKILQNNCNSLAGNGISGLNQLKQNKTRDETSRTNLPQTRLCLESRSLHKSKTVADGLSLISGPAMRKSSSAVEGLACSSSRAGDCNQWTKCGLSKDDTLSLKIGDTVRSEETPDTSAEGCIPGLDLTPDEVARVTGQRLFEKARKTMMHQQKIFSLQKFELHRLVEVQRRIARSPEILHENSFNPSRPPIKFPPINKLLYVASLDPSPSTAKPKTNTLKSTECGAEALRGLLPLPTTDVEKGHLTQPVTPKSLPNPPSVPMDPKLAPWCFPMPAGNQWLVPVRSPSEGLIYKPYPGPCFPNAGFMAPGHGNCTQMGLNLLGSGSTHCFSQPNEHGSGGFCSTELGYSYLQPHAANPSCTNPEFKLVIPSAGAQAGELDKTSSTGNSNFFVPYQIPRTVSTQQSAVSDSGGNLHKSNGSEMPGISETSSTERLEGEALSLFPTTPSLQPVKNEQRVHAIKVVPHNRMSASASVARIFQSIQEERKKHE